MSGRVGYRFHPTDEELVNHFLKNKMDGYDCLVEDDIHLINLLQFEPWELPGLAADQRSNDQLWYFFCKRELLYKNGGRPKFKRSTNTGHWKPTGSERPIKSKATNKKIGSKRTLVFYSRDSPKEVRTNWVIHEYQPQTVLPYQKDFVLCKLKEKADYKVDNSAGDEGESSHHNNSNGASDRHLVDTPIQQVDSQPKFHIEEEGISLDDFRFDHVFDNDSGESAFLLDTNELLDYDLDEPAVLSDTNEPQVDPNEMADSFIVVPDEHSGEKYFSSFVNIEAQSLPSPNLNNGPANFREYRQTRRVPAIIETLPSSAYNQSGKEKNHFHGDEILVMEASCSSADSTIDSYEKINRVGVVGKEFSDHTRIQSRSENIKVEKEITPETSIVQGKLSGTSEYRTGMHQQQSRYGNIKLEKGATPKTSIVQGKMSGASEYKAREARKNGIAIDPVQESPKENINVKTEKELKMANAKTSLKLTDNAITGNNKTGSFIRLETSLLSQRSPPPSVCAVNVVIGLVLIITVIWELLILDE